MYLKDNNENQGIEIKRYLRYDLTKYKGNGFQ